MPIIAWCDILRSRAHQSQGIAKRYLLWVANVLSRLKTEEPVSYGQVSTIWRRPGPARIENVMRASWAPILLLVLLIPQLHSPLMEGLSRWFQAKPDSPLLVFNRYFDNAVGTQDEVLKTDARFGRVRPKTALIGGEGKLIFKNVDFPRTNRSVCVMDFAKVGVGSRTCLPVRRALSKYEFSRTGSQPLLDLEVTLEPCIGGPFYEISIEHIRR
jgi:hypothetical protein